MRVQNILCHVTVDLWKSTVNNVNKWKFSEVIWRIFLCNKHYTMNINVKCWQKIFKNQITPWHGREILSSQLLAIKFDEQPWNSLPLKIWSVVIYMRLKFKHNGVRIRFLGSHIWMCTLNHLIIPYVSVLQPSSVELENEQSRMNMTLW